MQTNFKRACFHAWFCCDQICIAGFVVSPLRSDSVENLCICAAGVAMFDTLGSTLLLVFINLVKIVYEEKTVIFYFERLVLP